LAFDAGIGVFNHSGRRVICFWRPAGPTIAVRSSRASSGERVGSCRPTNSEKEGIAVSLSLKYVGRLLAGAPEPGFSEVDVDDSGCMVARHLEDSEEGCEIVLLTLRNGGALRHRNRLTVAAIVCLTCPDWTEAGIVGIIKTGGSKWK
jgi:hypothetical protein